MLKKYRTIIPVAIIAISFAMTLSQSIPKVIPVVMMAIAAILLIYTSRGTLYFSKASKALNKKEEGSMEKAIALYERHTMQDFLTNIYLLLEQYSCNMEISRKENKR